VKIGAFCDTLLVRQYPSIGDVGLVLPSGIFFAANERESTQIGWDRLTVSDDSGSVSVVWRPFAARFSLELLPARYYR